jgi:hypothetical protein
MGQSLSHHKEEERKGLREKGCGGAWEKGQAATAVLRRSLLQFTSELRAYVIIRQCYNLGTLLKLL